MLLKVLNITVKYERVEALKSIFFVMDKGSMVAILGANGAGKSTLIKTISGLKKPSSGEIWLNYHRIDHLSPQNIFAMGIVQVPEGRRLFPRMTVLENLFMGATAITNKIEMKKKLEEVFGYFPILKRRLNQDAGTLSGGEQQMGAIGRALMGNPKLLLLDEPSLGLAPIMVNELFSILKNIHENQIAILLAEQNARKALELAEEAYVMETGVIAISGRSEDIKENIMVKEAYLGG
jgi:branched-chain amino acid transport system ATP-binding protein